MAYCKRNSHFACLENGERYNTRCSPGWSRPTAQSGGTKLQNPSLSYLSLVQGARCTPYLAMPLEPQYNAEESR